MRTVSQGLAGFAAGVTYASLPEEVLEKARVTLLHNLGVALAGRSLLSAPYLYVDQRRAAGETGRSRLLVDGTALQPGTAAFVNAALMHARTQDDVYFPGLTHIGTVTIPAAIAVAEERDLDGRELLRAIVAAYEVTAAIAEGAAYESTPRGFRASGIYGVFGPAVAATLLLGGGEEQVANALGIAASFSAGLNQTWVAGTQEWQFHVGAAARNGILAAELAVTGGTGAPDALEGRAGFYRAFVGREADSALLDGLGSRWRIRDVTYKPYPVCAILQGPVLALSELAARTGLAAEDVRAIRLHLPPAEATYPGTDAKGPFDDVGGSLMSAAFCLSIALLEGTVRAVDLQRYTDRAVASLVERITVVADDALSPLCSRAEIETERGERLTFEFDSTARSFDWSRDEVADLLRSIVDETPFDLPAVETLIGTVLTIDDRPVRELVDRCIAET
jgi:2-methylcitrate dehydratase PrpD